MHHPSSSQYGESPSWYIPYICFLYTPQRFPATAKTLPLAMSLAQVVRPVKLQLTSALRPCQVCGISARRQWQATRSIHLSRSAVSQNIPTSIQDARWIRHQRRLASTTPHQAGPAIDLPSFPSHSRPAPAAPAKIEVQGTAPSFEALKEHEDWGEDTELLDDAEARIFVTEPALNVSLHCWCTHSAY